MCRRTRQARLCIASQTERRGDDPLLTLSAVLYRIHISPIEPSHTRSDPSGAICRANHLGKPLVTVSVCQPRFTTSRHNQTHCTPFRMRLFLNLWSCLPIRIEYWNMFFGTPDIPEFVLKQTKEEFYSANHLCYMHGGTKWGPGQSCLLRMVSGAALSNPSSRHGSGSLVLLGPRV